MTVSDAERLFTKAVRPGDSFEEVRNWLVAQAIPDRRNAKAHTIYYDLFRRPEGGGLSTDQYGDRTVAELAGLQNENVYSIIRVTYPDAARIAFGWIRITVYIFFDEKQRVIRYWILGQEYGPGGTPGPFLH